MDVRMGRRTLRGVVMLLVFVMSAVGGPAQALTLKGGKTNDIGWGTAQAEKISGGGGADFLFGLAGDDELISGGGFGNAL